jgi:hypothetical protein
MRSDRPRAPIVLERAFEDPEAVRALVPRHAPYWPVMRYAGAGRELEAMSGRGARFAVQPWFRGDWAGDAPPIDGVERVLANPLFVDAARRLFGARVVVPRIVYVNLMAPMAWQATAHSDIPIFRGVEKPACPVWLLHVMHRSGLFARWRVDVATAVAWFYAGEGGAFEYWADGPGAPPRRIGAPLWNRAIVGDNEVMFHRIASIGAPGARLLDGASVDCELAPLGSDGAEWAVRDGGRELARYPARELRVSISWKAEVFADAEAARVRSEHADDLDLGRVVDVLLEAIRATGRPVARPADPLRDAAFIEHLNELYPLPALVG